MTLVQCYPIGNIRMIDGGKLDDKIIAIPFSEPNYNNIKNIDELPQHIFEEIMHFFTVYKQLENKQTDVQSLSDRDSAVQIVQAAIDLYGRSFQGK